MTQAMKASEVRMQWGKLLTKVFTNQTRVVVEKSGIPVAAVISVDDLKRLTQLEKQRNERFKALDRMRDAFKDVPPKEAEREINRAITQIRSKTSARK